MVGADLAEREIDASGLEYLQMVEGIMMLECDEDIRFKFSDRLDLMRRTAGTLRELALYLQINQDAGRLLVYKHVIDEESLSYEVRRVK